MDVTEVMNVQKEKEQVKAAYQKALNTSVVYEGILHALSEDYFDLYYVDLETGEYTEYGSWTEEGQRSTEIRGTDFLVNMFFELYKCAKEKQVNQLVAIAPNIYAQQLFELLGFKEIKKKGHLMLPDLLKSDDIQLMSIRFN